MSIDPSLSKMAELRVRGQSWERMSQTFGVPSETMRSSILEHRSEWNRELRFAQKELQFEITAECLQALREKMIDDNPRIALDAAKTLLRFVQQSQKPAKGNGAAVRAKVPNPAPAPKPEIAQPASVPPKPAPLPTPTPTGNPAKKGMFSFFSVLMVLLVCFVESATAVSEPHRLHDCTDYGAKVLACNLRDCHHFACQEVPRAAGTAAPQWTVFGPEGQRRKRFSRHDDFDEILCPIRPAAVAAT